MIVSSIIGKFDHLIKFHEGYSLSSAFNCNNSQFICCLLVDADSL